MTDRIQVIVCDKCGTEISTSIENRPPTDFTAAVYNRVECFKLILKCKKCGKEYDSYINFSPTKEENEKWRR